MLPPGGAATWSDVDALDLPVGTHARQDVLLPARPPRSDAGRARCSRRACSSMATPAGTAPRTSTTTTAPTRRSPIAGAIIDASWIHDDGTMRTNDYVVPNAEPVQELPRRARRRRRRRSAPRRATSTTAASSTRWSPPAQLDRCADPRDVAARPGRDRSARPARSTQRARAWLDINCGHCHNPTRRGAHVGPVPRHRRRPTSRSSACASRRSRPAAARAACSSTSCRAMPDASIMVVSHLVDRARSADARARAQPRPRRGRRADPRVDRGDGGRVHVGTGSGRGTGRGPRARASRKPLPQAAVVCRSPWSAYRKPLTASRLPQPRTTRSPPRQQLREMPRLRDQLMLRDSLRAAEHGRLDPRHHDRRDAREDHGDQCRPTAELHRVGAQQQARRRAAPTPAARARRPRARSARAARPA